MLRCCLLMLIIAFSSYVQAQKIIKQLHAQRTNASFKIDGNLDEQAWKSAIPAEGFTEFRPAFNKPENPETKTIVYILYDNTAVYIGGYCYERSRDSVSKELVGRDVVGVNDFVGVIFDTYNDKINGVGFYVTPYGEQFDAKYSNSQTLGEDPSWNAVWNSAAKVHNNGWSFEMRIPYSALRFSKKEIQTWGLNITRRRNKTGQQYMWNPVDQKVNGFINQEGEWTGIENIRAPLRLSLSPYLSAYLNHYPYNTPGVQNTTSSLDGGMDVKYGISDGFTLDMTLVPDFGQVQSDNQVLNLTPFEVKYNENRPFFIEGTDLFSKGNLFYSRRIGGLPLDYYNVQDTANDANHLHSNEHFLKNPLESKLINGTKITGRTSKGLGIGFFNAITEPMFAEVEDSIGNKRDIKTNPLTNYNIFVLDQTLKNNSAVTFINTNVTRNSGYYNANVTAGLLDLNNKKNTYNLNAKLAVSQLYGPHLQDSVGQARTVSFGKSSGNFTFNIKEDAADMKYNINDLGILLNNNFLDHYLYAGYFWQKSSKWYNTARVNFNGYYSLLYNKFPGQFIASNFQVFTSNVNANVQLKNLWTVFMYLGYVPHGNDFYEPRTLGYSFRSPTRMQINPEIVTNAAKKYYADVSFFFAQRSLFNSPNYMLTLQHRYRFSDKFSITHNLNYNPTINDAGYYSQYLENNIVTGVIFSRRDLKTIENIVLFKYNFNDKSGITFRVRHYWSRVNVKQLYDLQTNGNLIPTVHNDVAMNNTSVNYFNIDAVYTLEFMPGSFLNIAWKQQGIYEDDNTNYIYLKNFERTVSGPQNNNLSVKVIYYLDYNDFKKRRKR